MPKAPTDPRYTTTALLGWLWRGYFKKHWFALFVAMVLMTLEGAALGIMSWMMQPLFDKVFVGGNSAALWWIGGLFAAIFAARGIIGVTQNIIMAWIGATAVTEMQGDLLGHLIRLDSQFFQDNPPGALIERVQGDTGAVANVWQTLIRSVGKDTVTLISLMSVVILIDPIWTLVAFAGLPLLVLPTYSAQRYIRKKTRLSREIATHRTTRLDEVFHGINPIKLNAMEDYQNKNFRQILEVFRRASVKAATGQATVPGLVDIVTGIGLCGIIVYAGSEIVSGEKSLGQFMSFFTAIGLVFQPLRRLGSVAGIVQVAAASIERLHRLFELKPTIVSRPGAANPAADTGISFENVAFSYGDTSVLRGTTFTAKSGKTTALVGASGAGKSTVFNLLTRLIDADSGIISVGDIPVEDIDLFKLRNLFSVVSQDSLLFDETLRENILLGRQDVDEDHLRSVLDAAQVSPFLSQLPNGLESRAGPRGTNLSGGQRQRISIARALLRDAPILLLDEATSALDTKSEAAVQSALDKLSANRTTLVIAHRLSTVKDADHIVVMDQGRVVEQGKHDELLEKGGVFAQLHALQFKEQESSNE